MKRLLLVVFPVGFLLLFSTTPLFASRQVDSSIRPTLVHKALVHWLSRSSATYTFHFTHHAQTAAFTPRQGPTWQPLALPTAVTTKTISSLLVHPQNAANLLLATQHGLYRSIDAGSTWSHNDTLGDRAIFEIVQAEADPTRLYVRSWQFLRSDNDGHSWQELALPDHICGLAVAPSLPDRLYARRCGDAQLPPVLRSNDGGRSWITPSNRLTVTFDFVAVSPVQPDTLIASNFDQTWRSTDGGDSWQKALVGMRYFAKPYFDHQTPPTLYLGHWSGFLRSQDEGLSWQDSDASREITTLAPLADQAGQIIAGNGAESWRFQLGASEWQATSFTAPANLLTLIGSAADAQVLYARSEQGFWRLDFRPPQRIEDQIIYYLPLIQNGVVQPQTRSAVTAANDQCRSVTTDARSSDCATAAFAQTDLTVAELAVERANDYRTLVGVMPLHLHPSLIASAQNHTNYLVTNYTDPSAWTYGAHGEVQGLPFFTGQWPKDRIVVTGYPWWGGAEVIHGYGDPVASIDGWIATVYHRFPILEPYNHYAGYANHASAPVQADILDFGAGPMSKGVWMPATPFPLAYPINGQIEIPTGWNGSELPNPLPPGTQGPVGYPFTLQAIGGKMRIMTAALRTESGEVVPTFPNPSDCAAGRCLALIAVEPLQPQVTYIASAAGDISGIPFASEWHFTTGAESMAVTAATALPAAGAPLAEVNQIPPPKQMNAESFSAQP